MKLGAAREYLRKQHGLQIKASRIHRAIDDGRIDRPPKDTDGSYDFGAVHISQMVDLWGQKKNETN